MSHELTGFEMIHQQIQNSKVSDRPSSLAKQTGGLSDKYRFCGS